MPWTEVMHKFKAGDLKSGSGGKVTNRKQAIAIMLHEKKEAAAGNKEYQPIGGMMKAAARKGKK